MSLTLINSFVVPLEQEDEFVKTWRETVEHFVDLPGFIETKLHRNTGLNDKTFLYVNVALWENDELYHAAFESFIPAGQRIPGVQSHPGLYEVVIEVKAGDHPAYS